MWIKICGTTSLEDAQLAVEAGADALGFVFAKSPRQVTAEQAKDIVSQLGQNVEKIGVFVDEDCEAIVSAVRMAGLTGVQLHGPARTGEMLARRLRERLADGGPHFKRVGILRVLHYDETLDVQITELSRDEAVDAVLVDSRSAKAPGGTGVRFDWQAASRSFFEAAPHLRMIVAGGLNPENVREAIETLGPWGVDVVSGVEAEPGRKDPARVKEFVKAARAADGASQVVQTAEA